MSACSEYASQSDTVVRKLLIMMPTPIVAATATIKAEMAIPVRLRPAPTAFEAIRPTTPKSPDTSGRTIRLINNTPAGAASTNPIITRSNPA